jgi:hypothetical protein
MCVARAIALTVPCLPHSLADEKRVSSLTRPDRGARFTDVRTTPVTPWRTRLGLGYRGQIERLLRRLTGDQPRRDSGARQRE